MQFEEVRIENTNHCGYRCFCCPREALSRPRGFMPLADFRLVTERVGTYTGSVDLHGFGEPLLDPLLPERVSLAREAWPQAMLRIITTLGVELTADTRERLVRCGLSAIEVSFYGSDAASYQETHGRDRYDLALANLVALTEACADVPSPPAIVMRGLTAGGDQPAPLTSLPAAVQDRISAGAIQAKPMRLLHNFGNGRHYSAVREGTVCSVVWGYRRRVLQVTWDLDVIPCCFDYNAEVKFGNLRTQSLPEIFSSDTYLRFLDDHRRGALDDYPPCRTCERCDRP
jgi:radical SAM protein with 4Fe4S-binding SPASM domain